MANLSRESKRRALATVETALVLPIIFGLAIGILEFGYLFLVYQQVTNATRAGARAAALPNSSYATVNTAVANAMASPLNLKWTGTPVCTPDPSKAAVGSEVKVEVSYPYQSFTSVFPGIPKVVKGSVIMAKEGP